MGRPAGRGAARQHDIFIPGETVADPPCPPQDWDSLYAHPGVHPQPHRHALAEGAGWAGQVGGHRIPDIVINQAQQPPEGGHPACLDELRRRGGAATCCCCSPTACTPALLWLRDADDPAPSCSASSTPPINSHDSETTTTRGPGHRPATTQTNATPTIADVAVLIGHTRATPTQLLRG